MICFVDEDVSQIRPWASELRAREFEVAIYRNADVGFNKLASREQVQLVLIDVMLAADADEARSRYSRVATDSYMKTGLVFLEDLAIQNPKLFPRRAALLTTTTIPKLWNLAQETATHHQIPLLRKTDFASPYEFGNRICDIVQSIHG